MPLVVLGFAALWAFPVLTSVVGGDLFSAEDRYGTWATVLTRSRSRAEVFAGKVLTALGFSSLAVAALAVSSVAAGVLVIGPQPLINLSGAAASAGAGAEPASRSRGRRCCRRPSASPRWPCCCRWRRGAAPPASDCRSSPG